MTPQESIDTMQAKELMIGDLILCDDKIPMRVAHTDRHLKIWVDSYDREKYPHYGYGTCERYTPIPITAEILEKNGFVNDASYDECIADYCFVTIQLWRYHEENILIDWDGIITRVTHDMANLCESVELRDAKVHELQHALRLCGLNDLADNFVI